MELEGWEDIFSIAGVVVEAEVSVMKAVVSKQGGRLDDLLLCSASFSKHSLAAFLDLKYPLSNSCKTDSSDVFLFSFRPNIFLTHIGEEYLTLQHLISKLV